MSCPGRKNLGLERQGKPNWNEAWHMLSLMIVLFKLLTLQGYLTEVTNVPSQQQMEASIRYAHTKKLFQCRPWCAEAEGNPDLPAGDDASVLLTPSAL